MTYVDYAKTILKKSRYRLTGTRISLLDTLSKIKEPMNAYDLLKKMQQRDKEIDIVTIYRILNILEKMSLVHKIAGGYMSCQEFECKNLEHCHHHFICNKCGYVTEMHLSDLDFLNKVREKFSNLLINSHSFEFSGLCAKCKK